MKKLSPKVKVCPGCPKKDAFQPLKVPNFKITLPEEKKESTEKVTVVNMNKYKHSSGPTNTLF